MSARSVEHSLAPHMHDFYAVSLNYAGRLEKHGGPILNEPAAGQ